MRLFWLMRNLVYNMTVFNVLGPDGSGLHCWLYDAYCSTDAVSYFFDIKFGNSIYELT